MTTPKIDTVSNVLPFPPPPPPGKIGKAAADKWGEAVIKQGYSMIPSLLLRAQRRLGINPTQLAILLQIADFWWDEGRKPYPSKQTLADRLGLKERQVQRHIAELEKAGLVTRVARFDSKTRARTTNTYDLTGLVARLQQLEPEFRLVEEENRQRRRAVQMPGGLRGRGKAAASAPAPVQKDGAQ